MSCPLCGGALRLTAEKRGFVEYECPQHGAVYVCSTCGYTARALHSIVAHMRKHRRDTAQERAILAQDQRNTGAIPTQYHAVATQDYAMRAQDRAVASQDRAVPRSALERLLGGDTSVLGALSDRELLELIALMLARLLSFLSSQPQPQPSQPAVEAAGADFIVGNPWLSIIARKFGEGGA